MYVTATLEFSGDPLSDTTPTYVDVTGYLLEASWSSGIQKEGDEPQAGQAVFVLDDRTRRFEPEYAAGAYYPNVVPERRFRWKITSSAVTYQQGTFYAAEWQPRWPDRVTNQETTVTCGDGIMVFAADALPSLDPPDAQSVEDVIASDNPWGAWGLDDPAGTRAVSQVRMVRRGKGKKRRKVRTRRYETAAEATTDAGQAGVYKNTPTLGVPGLVVGDPATATLFTAAQQESVQVATDAENFVDRNAATLACWVKPTTTATMTFMALPNNSAGATTGPIFQLLQGSASAAFRVSVIASDTLFSADSTTTPVAGTIYHLAGTYDGSSLCIYVDGQLEDEVGASGLMDVQSENILYIGRRSAGDYTDGVIGRPAVYEYALSAERVLAHYQAGALRGFPQQTAGERIAALATSPLWNESFIQTSGRDVLPVMMFGQSRLDEIAETAHAEGPRTMFYFESGDPIYLGWEWQATAAVYNTVQATIGNNSGEVPYEDVEMVTDDEFYTDVVVSHEAGELAEASTGVTPRRVNSEFTDVLLMEHTEVESLAENVLAFYEKPAWRPASVTLTGVDATSRLHILQRNIGDLIRIKHRPRGGTVIDRVCNIIGYDKKLEPETGNLTCTWFLGRGFNAAEGFWRAGIVGFSEAGATTDAA